VVAEMTPVEAAETDLLPIPHTRTCTCASNHVSCTDAKEWIKAQLGVWQFTYEKRDVRDKAVHPATFPIALPKRWIELLTHRGELVLDPFVGAGSTLVAARDAERNAAGFDLSSDYVRLAKERLNQLSMLEASEQLAVQADAREIPRYLAPETVALIVTSPPYANLLNRHGRTRAAAARSGRTASTSRSSSTQMTCAISGCWPLMSMARPWVRSSRACFRSSGLAPIA